MTKRKLKIAIFHLAFIYSGGGEKLVLKEYDLLKKAGHKVDIYTSVINDKKCFPDVIKKYRIKTFIPKSVFYNHESFRVVLSSFLFPLFAFRFRNYDVILAANQPSSWMAFIVKKIYKIPYVSYLAQPTRFLHPRIVDKETGLRFVKHEDKSYAVTLMNHFKKFINWADKKSIKNSDIILANGEYVKFLLNKTYKVESISCPAGTDNFLSKTKIFKFPYILMTNRHYPQKRFEVGIVAFSEIASKFPKLKLVITGEETEYTNELRVLIERLGLKGRIIFTGYIKEKDLPNYYKYSKAYLYTAPEEDFGMGVVEAFVAGSPVIAWNKCGPSKVVVSGRTGLLVNPEDTAGFGKCLKMVLTNPKISKDLVRNAKKEAKRKYLWKNHLETLEDSLISSVSGFRSKTTLE
jgi:glycosyltransferase involved in cell wall biosynthesis